MTGFLMILRRLIVQGRGPLIVALGFMVAMVVGIRPTAVAWLIVGSRNSMESGNYEVSAVRLRIARLLDPRNRQIALLQARTHRHLQSYGAVSALLDRAQELGIPSDVAQLERKLVLVQRGGIRDAQKQLKNLLSDPFVDPAEVCDAFAYGAWQRDEAQWRFFLDRWFEASPSDSRQFLTRGEMCEETEQWPFAEEAYRQALHLDPRNSRARLGLGSCLRELTRPKEALVQFESVLNAESGNLSALEGAAKCLIELGDIEQATKLLSQVLREEPQNFAVNLEMARLDLRQNQPKQAASRLKPLAVTYPNQIEVRYNLARALQAIGAIEEAEGHFRHHQHLQIEMARGDKLVDRIRNDPNDLEARYELGMTILKSFTPSKGVYWLSTVLARDPMHRRTNEALAEYYELQGKSQLAARHRNFNSMGNAADLDETGTAARQLQRSNPRLSGE